MKIKTCLITAAGFGTRMGEIGKRVPKPLWPIFNKTLLDLQLAYARNLGVENIYINSHHQADLIREWSNGKNITLLEEEEILGSGGCVHNLYHHLNDKKQTILIINSDQFYFFSKSHLEKAHKMLSSTDACAHLIGIEVNKSEKYNETVIEQDCLINIEKPKGDTNYITYSGVGLIDLERVNYVEGASGFFDTVCNFREDKVLMTTPEQSEYWDFGTKIKYLEGMFEVLEDKESEMYNFLIENKVFDEGVEILEQGDNSKEIKLDLYNLKLIKQGDTLSLIEE